MSRVLVKSGKNSWQPHKQKNYWENWFGLLSSQLISWFPKFYKKYWNILYRSNRLEMALWGVWWCCCCWWWLSESSDVMQVSQTLTVLEVGPRLGLLVAMGLLGGDCVVVSGGGSSVSLFAIGAHHPWACSAEILPSGGLPPLLGPGHQHHWHHQHHQRNKQIATPTSNTFIYTIKCGSSLPPYRRFS